MGQNFFGCPPSTLKAQRFQPHAAVVCPSARGRPCPAEPQHQVTPPAQGWGTVVGVGGAGWDMFVFLLSIFFSSSCRVRPIRHPQQELGALGHGPALLPRHGGRGGRQSRSHPPLGTGRAETGHSSCQQ